MTSETPTPAATSAIAQTDQNPDATVPADTSSVRNPSAIDTLPVQSPKKIDWDEINVQIAKDREEKAKNLAVTRDNLLSILNDLGVTEVTGEYDGYGDSGNVESVSVAPSSVTIDGTLDQSLASFIWDMAYQQSP